MFIHKLKVDPVRSNFVLSCLSICAHHHNMNPSNLTKLKSFKDIPCPRIGKFPFIGHGRLLVKPYGKEQLWKNVRKIREEMGNIEMMRMHLPMMSKSGRCLWLFKPEDVALLFQNEPTYPTKGGVLSVFGQIRKRIPGGIFDETVGVALEEGSKWQEIRSRVQQDLMRVESAMFYLNQLEEVSVHASFFQFLRRERLNFLFLKVADDFVQMLRNQYSAAGNEVQDASIECQKYSFEAISLVATNQRLGVVPVSGISEGNDGGEAIKAMESLNQTFRMFPKISSSFPIWNYLPNPRMSKLFRDLEDATRYHTLFIRDKVEDSLEKLRACPSQNKSVLERLTKSNSKGSSFPVVMAIDMMSAGMDTTGCSLTFLLHNLAKYPEKQEKLRQEVKLCTNLTAEKLKGMKYLNACIKENLRRFPVSHSNIRIIDKNIIIRDHLIPEGTAIMFNNELLGRDQEHFTDPEEFRPERWLQGPRPHPFCVRPFGHGKRICIGKR